MSKVKKIVHFVDIGRIVDHHVLHCLFIIINSVPAHPSGPAVILVIMSVKAFKTAVILYIFFSI